MSADDKPIFYQTEVEAIVREIMREERETLRLVIREEVAQATADHKCRFNVPAAAVDEAGHAFGIARDLGDGDLSKGLERIRDNHKWLNTARSRSERIGSALLVMFLTLSAGGISTALWLGVKSLLAIKE